MARKNPAAVTLGRLGGKARAEKLSRAQRKVIAKQGGFARWKKARKHADHLPKAPKSVRSSKRR